MAETKIRLADVHPGGRFGVAVALAGGLWAACACSATTSRAEIGARGGAAVATPMAVAPAGSDPALMCRAGTLPRLGASAVAEGADALIAASKRGAIAVVWDGTHATVVDGCRLDGTYAVIPGRGGKGVFRATNRVLFRTDELPADCRGATHLVAALASDGGAAGAPTRLGAILVPLPCPSVSERRAATGCLGKGQTGPQRRKRAAGLLSHLESQPDKAADSSVPLEIFALAPDAVSAVGAVERLTDTGMIKQARFIAGQFDVDDSVDPPALRLRKPAQRTAPPTLDWQAPSIPVANEPAFLHCFPDIVDPDVQFTVIPARGAP